MIQRLLALDWDEQEARYLFATAFRDRLTVRAAGTVPLVDVGQAGGVPQPDLAGSLRNALAGLVKWRPRLLLAAERSRIELLHFELPPAQDFELPELVRNQAVRELQLPPEQFEVDFVPLRQPVAAANSLRKVMAAAITREEIDRIRTILASLRLKPYRMLLRPLAAGSLLLRAFKDIAEPCVVVNKLPLEADLSIINFGQVIFSRTVRLPGSTAASQAQRFVGEIERTIMVAQSQELEGEPIAAIYLLGNQSEHEQLLWQLSDRVSTPVHCRDPFEVVSAFRCAVPPESGRFAGLIGMLLDEAAGAKHPVDLLHPRKPPKTPSKARIAAAIGGILFLGLTAWGYTIWSEYAEIAGTNAALESELRELNETASRAARQQRLINAVAQWQAADINWLDELGDLSLRLPSARDLVVGRMTMSVSGATGSIFLQGLIRDPKIVHDMERSIRDSYRRVQTPRIQEREVSGDYAWVFETALAVSRRPPQQYVLYQATSPTPAVESDELADRTASAPSPPVEEPAPQQAKTAASSGRVAQTVGGTGPNPVVPARSGQ